MIRSMLCSALLAGLTFASLAGTASAQQPTQAQAGAIRSACRSDFQALCSGVPTGGTAALNCLQSHQQSLTQPCHAAVSAVGGGGAAAAQSKPPAPQAAPSGAPPMAPREEARVLRNACGADYRTYCRGVELGGGRAIGCLRENATRLSPPCRGALAGLHS